MGAKFWIPGTFWNVKTYLAVKGTCIHPWLIFLYISVHGLPNMLLWHDLTWWGNLKLMINKLERWNTRTRWSSGLRREIQVFLPGFLGVASPHLERGVGSNPTRVIFWQLRRHFYILKTSSPQNNSPTYPLGSYIPVSRMCEQCAVVIASKTIAHNVEHVQAQQGYVL